MKKNRLQPQFVIKINNSISEEIQRILLEQIRFAQNVLKNPDGIHNARKSIKKIRAILQLIRSDIGGRFQDENAFFRDTSKKLSDARDAEAMIEAVDKLVKHDPNSLPKKVAKKLKGELASLESSSTIHLSKTKTLDKMKHTRKELNACIERFSSLEFRLDSFESIKNGFQKIYSKGKKELRKSQFKPTTEVLHDWRKRVKAYWYVHQLLRNLWPEGILPYIEQSKIVSECLGDDHDLTLLQELLYQSPQYIDQSFSLENWSFVIQTRRVQLRQQAWIIGEKIYAESDISFVQRLECYWNSNKSSQFSI